MECLVRSMCITLLRKWLCFCDMIPWAISVYIDPEDCSCSFFSRNREIYQYVKGAPIAVRDRVTLGHTEPCFRPKLKIAEMSHSLFVYFIIMIPYPTLIYDDSFQTMYVYVRILSLLLMWCSIAMYTCRCVLATWVYDLLVWSNKVV